MTMPYSPGRALFEGNGTATDFPFSFKVWGTEQLTVTLTGPDGNSRPASGWTARLNDDGGSVTYLHEGAPLPAGWKLAITRNMPFEQQIDLVSGTRFDAEVIETGLDRATAERQQLLEQLQRAVILPPTSDETPIKMAEQLLQAGKAAQASAAAAQASESAAASSASQSAASAQAAAASAEAADQSRAAAAASAADASQSATAARQSAEAAAGSEDRAAQSAASILGLQVEVSTLDPGLPAGGDYDPETGILHLGIPKGDSGASAIATPTSLGSVMPQTGHEDGLELETDGKLRVRKASASQRGGVLASTTAAANTVPQAGEDGTLDASWVPRPDYWDMFPPFVPVPIWGATPSPSGARRLAAVTDAGPSCPEKSRPAKNGFFATAAAMAREVPCLTCGAAMSAVPAKPSPKARKAAAKMSLWIFPAVPGTLSTTQMPSHTHPFSAVISTKGRYMESGNLYDSGRSNTSATGGNGSHTHPLSGSVSGTHTDPHLAMHFFIKVV